MSDQDKQEQDFDPAKVKVVLGSIIHLLDRLNKVVEDGFSEVNERLARLEGKDGMQGVTKQLVDIKGELQKIQKAYPYDDLLSNMQTVKQGEA